MRDFDENTWLVLKIDYVKNVIQKYLDWIINDELIEVWANVLEWRDDYEFETELLLQIIIELANPALYWKITGEKAWKILKIMWEF